MRLHILQRTETMAMAWIWGKETSFTTGGKANRSFSSGKQ